MACGVCMCTVYVWCKYMVIYLDDILIYSEDVTSHIRHSRYGLQGLRNNKLFAKLEKYALHI